MRILRNIFLILICIQGWTQEPGAEDLPDPGIEKYKIISDRGMYIAGEDINFRVFNLEPESVKKMKWSSVFYMELISPQGQSHQWAKFALDSTGVSSAIHIPENLPSGIYYLKGYTRWMRNNGPDTYAYLSVQIVNPHIRTIVPVDTTSDIRTRRMEHVSYPSSTGPVSGSITAVPETSSLLSMTLKRNDSLQSVDCCVSVTRKGMQKTQWESSWRGAKISQTGMYHLPETRGVSLVGKVEFAETGLPASYALVLISVIGNERDFYCNFTDSAGRFHFAFPDIYGEKELFISAEHHAREPVKLYVDQDFCTESLALPSYPLEVQEEDFDLIGEMSNNAQIRAQYYTKHYPTDTGKADNREFFYGHPTTIVLFDDFIRLPTMEEYFTEVTPKVSIKKSSRGTMLRVLGDHPDLGVFSPLVMVDGVAIGEVESVLSVSPRLIKQIEIVEAPYIRGNITFGGIINIISRNDDLGFINLPESGIIAQYRFYNQDYSGIQCNPDMDHRHPDVRNTLYWNPHLDLKPGEDKIINFKSGYTKGEYEVIIRGYDDLGSYFQEAIPFRVDSP